MKKEIIELILHFLCAIMFTYSALKNPYKEVKAICRLAAFALWLCVGATIAQILIFL